MYDSKRLARRLGNRKRIVPHPETRVASFFNVSSGTAEAKQQKVA